MAVYCTNCGETIDEGLNFCPYCGVALTGNSAASNGTSEVSDAAKTAATVGGAFLGGYALSSLFRGLRRRPPHHPPHHHHHHGPRHGHGHGRGGHGHR